MNLRAMVVSSQARLYLGEHEIGNKKAETSELIPFIDKLRHHYGRTELLNVVSIDSGMAHRSNMNALRERGIHFIMGLKANQPTIFASNLSRKTSTPLLSCKQQLQLGIGLQV